MYVEINFNLIYQVEKIAQREKRSVTEIVNEAVEQYLQRQASESSDLPKPKADDTP